MDKILVLGTGNAQADLIKALKERDHKNKVYSCSYINGDTGEQYSDEFKLINITDAEAVKDFVNEQQIDIVYSAGSDVAMPTVCKVSEDLGKKHFVSYQTALTCNTKNLLRDYLGPDFKGNIPFQSISEGEEITLNFPYIIKPVDSQGQRGVFLINNDEELKEKLPKSFSHSKKKRVIAEEFIDGPEISVNSFSVDGEVLCSIVSDREVWSEYPGGIIHKHHVPSVYAGTETEEKIKDLVKRTLEKLKIKNGPAYFQIKIRKDGEPILIEVTPRLDGCHMWRLLKMTTGVDLLDATISLLTDNNKETIREQFKKEYEIKPGTLEFFCLPPKSTMDRSKFDTDNAEYLCWYYEDGQPVKQMNGYMEKCGYKIFENKELNNRKV